LQEGCPLFELAGNYSPVHQRTDSDLLRDYAENVSEAAFAELVSRHIGLVYSAALRVVVDTHLAEDVTQATFAVLAKEARHLAGRAFLSSWLHRTASNQAANLVRGEMRRRAREQEAYTMQIVPTESAPGWEQVAPLLDAALNKLAEADRAVILLRFFEKKTAADIAATLSVSEDAAQKRVYRALDRLRGLLSGQGAALSTTTLAALITAQAVVATPTGLSTSVSAAALAGGTVGGGITVTTLKLVIMSKIKISAVSALLVAAVATPLVIQHQRLTRLREENQSLQQQVRQAGNLRGENEKFDAQRAKTVNALKQIGMQLRLLERNNNVQAAIAADGSLDPGLLAKSLPNFDMKQVELLVSDPSQHKAPGTIIARTAEPMSTPDGRWLRVYLLADGSVQQKSTENPDEAFDGSWHLAQVKPRE
jgi:RNA polymerase sigma factor (sigma-70 family)